MLKVAVIVLALFFIASCDNSDKTTIVNLRPKAFPGIEKTVQVGDMVLLDGTESTDPDGDLLSFDWSIISTPKESDVVLDNPKIGMTFFAPDMEGEYVFSLVVNDGKESSEPQSVSVRAMNVDVKLSNYSPSLSAFGYELGEPFTPPECPVLDLGKYSERRVYIPNPEYACYKNFDNSQRPNKLKIKRQMHIPQSEEIYHFENGLLAKGIFPIEENGLLIGFSIFTFGYDEQSQVYESLVDYYGNSSSVSNDKVVKSDGVEVEKIVSRWIYDDMIVLFVGFDADESGGFITVATRDYFDDQGFKY